MWSVRNATKTSYLPNRSLSDHAKPANEDRLKTGQ
jgi:hypothetical protein